MDWERHPAGERAETLLANEAKATRATSENLMIDLRVYQERIFRTWNVGLEIHERG
jgi:hypothetical protein